MMKHRMPFSELGTHILCDGDKKSMEEILSNHIQIGRQKTRKGNDIDFWEAMISKIKAGLHVLRNTEAN